MVNMDIRLKGNSHKNVSVILEIITVVLKSISTLPRKKEIMQVQKMHSPDSISHFTGPSSEKNDFYFILPACAELLLKLCSSFESASFSS